MGDESSVRVAVRIRPQIARERIEMCRVCTSVTPGEPQVWLGSDKAFTYDYVFDMPTPQEDVYATCVESLVDGCFDGYNATVLAYGQTGSGKTYTMGTGLDIETSPDTLGIVPRAVIHLFNGIDERRTNAREQGIPPPDFKVTAHFMELYNEEIIDLFDPEYKGVSKSSVKIHEDTGGGIYVTGVTTRNVVSVDETLGCLRTGALSRTTGSTNMNAQSSRSHAIFTLNIKQQRLVQPGQDEFENENESDVPEFETLTSKFHFVDLAGSERLKRTGATGERAREGISINCGLLALGNVISALGDSSKRVSHVPYRDSKLTRLLQDSLGGNSRTLMIACVSPSDTDFMETLNTLKYANRARNIKNKVVVNQDKTSKTLALLRQEIQTLQIELMEYKQGKRVITADGSEGLNDMYHENQMLLTEAENLRTRIKALQETVEMLTMKNTQLLAERAAGEWGSSNVTGEGGSEFDITGVVHGYLKEVEELRAKLCESENLCQQLRKQLNNRNNAVMLRSSLSPMHGVAMTGSIMDCMEEEDTQSITDLIEEAKLDLKHDIDEIGRKKRVNINNGIDSRHAGDDTTNEDDNDDEEEEKYDEEDSSDESGEDKDAMDDDSDEDEEERPLRENYNAELADLTSEISIKQKLIESLEATQRRLETMKFQYEEKLNMMMNRIKATQEERDKVLANMKQNGPLGGGNDDRVKAVRQEYQKKLTQMESEVKKLKVAQKEHAKLMKERSAHERQLKSLKAEMADMKRNKVKLIQKMKEEANRAKKEDMKQRKEIAQLRKEHRKKENYIRSLEADNRLKTSVLRRKTEEISNLKKAPRKTLSDRVAGRFRKKMAISDGVSFSPKVAKQKWLTVEQSINKVAYNKQTVSSLERDMDRWLRERESLSRQLDKIKRRRERMDPSNANAVSDLNDQLEACQANIDYIHENISECQENIMSMEESKEAMDMLETSRVTTGLSPEEIYYLVSKLISMSINQATLAAQRQAAIAELEGKMKQMEQTTSVQEQLLAHVLRDNDMNVYHLMSSLVAGDDNTPGSTESSRSNSPVEGILGSFPSLEHSSDSLRRREKARRKTATTEDMLFTGSDKPLSASTTALNRPYEPFLSAPVTNNDASSSSAPPTLDPRMTTSLEGTLGVGGGSNSGLGKEKDRYQSSNDSNNAFIRGVPRVTSAPNPLKMLVTTNRGGNKSSSPSLTRKPYERQDGSGGGGGVYTMTSSPRYDVIAPSVTSPRIGRKHLAALSSTVLSANRHLPAENQNEVTPPSSPLSYRRTISKEENVFNRLTSATSSVRERGPDTGVIIPHPGKVNQRSVLACTHVAQGHSKAVLSVFATDDKIFSASKDRTVKVWDLVRGQEILTLGNHPNNVNCVKYNEANNLCFSVSSSFIKVWDLRQNPTKCTKTLSSSGLTSNGSVSISGNSRTLQMPPGETQINDISLSESSNVLYSAAGNIVRIWDLRKFMSIGKLSGAHQAAVMCLAVESSRQNQDVVVTGSKDHYIKVFDVGQNNSGLICPRRSLDPPHYDGIQSLAIYGNTLFSGSRDMCIKKWDLNRGDHVQSLNNAHKDWICALRFLPGGQIVLSGCRGGTIKMWSADTCHMIGELRAHASPINAITTNSTCIFTASNDCTIGLWRMRTSYDVSPELSDSAC